MDTIVSGCSPQKFKSKNQLFRHTVYRVLKCLIDGIT
jgi:hypothetical protein